MDSLTIIPQIPKLKPPVPGDMDSLGASPWGHRQPKSCSLQVAKGQAQNKLMISSTIRGKNGRGVNMVEVEKYELWEKYEWLKYSRSIFLSTHLFCHPSSTMARTKMTAKKSNGGSVPLRPPQDLKNRPFWSRRQVQECSGWHQGDSAECYEENTLFMCMLCPRVVCRLCLQLMPEIEANVLQDSISFRCICCHIKILPAGPYFGFYKASGVPLLNSFFSIKDTLEVSQHAEISAAPVIFIHLILVDFNIIASPFQLAHDFLKPYFTGGGIEYVEVYYDIATDTKLAPYWTKVCQLIKGLKNSFVWERVVIGVSTHTDEGFRDPFTGYEDDDTKGYVTTPVNDFLEIILDPWQAIVDHAQESYLWMLCCGSVINNSDSFIGLQEAVVWHNLTVTIAFNAPRFQPSFATHLLIAFTERVLIGHCPIRLAFKDMLAQSCDLGRHSDVFLLTPVKEGALNISRFAWAHSEVHPWGNFLSIQCGGCGWADSWRSAFVKGTKARLTFLSAEIKPVVKHGSTWLDIPVVAQLA
ncbi:hypothetical protein DFH29DRAFT_879913 [Suillus ampliporus]|nr:hypothetical protein DFH29DRAFT_879913 [Suillus ampliporus]